MKKTICIILASALVLSAAGCAKEAEAPVSETTSAVQEEAVKVTASVTEDTKYKAAILSVSPEEFESAGFSLGDSCNVRFASGLTLDDVPFYNGYYVKNGAPVIVAYPGDGCVKITYNNEGIWESESLEDGEGVTVTLTEKGKYTALQESLGQVYSVDRADYESDEQFCNFRALTGGSIKKDYFYRGASPVDNSRGRAAYTDSLLKAYGIRFILDLADSEDDMSSYLASAEFSSPCAESIFSSGNTALLSMGSGFTTDEYKQKAVEGFKQMMNSDGPVYIHCMEGKDRTGFICFLLEALAGASYDEMRSDYMLTYGNYYGVTADGTPEKYNAIADLYFDSFAFCLLGTEDKETLRTADYTEGAEKYLADGGMSESEITALRAYITE